MTASTRWWFGTFIVVVFLAGTSVGVIVDRVWLMRGGPSGARPVLTERGPRVVDINRMVEVNLAGLRRHFALTASQEGAVRPLLEAWANRIAGMQASTRTQLQAETIRLETELAALLTPEQRDHLSTARSVLALPAPGRGGRFGGPDGGRRGGPGRVGPGFGPGGSAGRGRE
jgi:hypothetical protein